MNNEKETYIIADILSEFDDEEYYEMAKCLVNEGYGNVKQYQDEIECLKMELMHREEDLAHADEKVFYREMAVRLEEDKIKRQVVKEFCENKVEPLIEELVELLFNDDKSNCMVQDCNKSDDIPCGSSICIGNNKEVWKKKLDDLITELYGANK